MSAFIVGRAHIDALIQAGLDFAHPGFPMRWFTRGLTEDEQQGAYMPGQPWGPEGVTIRRAILRQLTRESADETGRMLWAENLASVSHRYPDDSDGELPGPISFCRSDVETYRYHRTPRHHSAVDILKALDCYEYQSCEHPGWTGSEAERFCDALRRTVIHHLAGYDAAGWEITETRGVPAA